MPCLMLLMLSYRLDSNSLLLNLINCLMVTNNLMSMGTTSQPNLTKVLQLRMSCIQCLNLPIRSTNRKPNSSRIHLPSKTDRRTRKSLPLLDRCQQTLLKRDAIRSMKANSVTLTKASKGRTRAVTQLSKLQLSLPLLKMSPHTKQVRNVQAPTIQVQKIPRL